MYNGAGERTALVDARGNRTSFTYDADGRETLSLNPLLQRTTLGYDGAGQQTLRLDPRGFRTTYAYDNAGRIEKRRYPDGSRITWSYDPVGNPLVIASPYGRYTRTYDEGYHVTRLAQRRDNESSFYHYDALGSTAALTDGSQTETDSYFYKAFGALLASSGTTDNPFTWVGQLGYYRDQTTGLYSLRAREYGSAAGRFLSEDALRFIIGDENLFRYVNNNPPNLGDPSGNQPIAILPLNGPTPRREPGEYPIVIVPALDFTHPSAPRAPGEYPIIILPQPLTPPTAREPIEETPIAQVDMANIPSERINEILRTPEASAYSTQCYGQQIVVAPLIIDGRIVKAVFIENLDMYCQCDVHGMAMPTYSSPGTFRLVGTAPSEYGSDVAADNYCESHQMVCDEGCARVMTAVLHTLPFGTLADRCAHGEDSGVGNTELILTTIADCAFAGGLLAKTTGARGTVVDQRSNCDPSWPRRGHRRHLRESRTRGHCGRGRHRERLSRRGRNLRRNRHRDTVWSGME